MAFSDGDGRKVFDCFTFFNELDLLEIRLNELDGVVDRFVLCEARQTFKGKPKPLVFAENRQRFARFLPKIEHVVLDALPSGGHRERDFFRKEKVQRNALIRGLANARPDDLVILSDLDEIPSADAVRRALAYPRPAVFVLQMSHHFYFLNLAREGSWDKGRIARFGDIRSMQVLRSGGPGWQPKQWSPGPVFRQWRRMVLGVRHIRPWVALADAGWHLTYMNGPEAVVQKMAAYSHDRRWDAEQAATRMADAIDQRLNRMPFDTLPALVQSEPGRFAHLIAGPNTARELREAFPSSP